MGRVEDWRRRGLDLWRALEAELSPFVPTAAIEQLLGRLIRSDNPACMDRGNAAHVMAQNDNVVVLARWGETPPSALALALAGGFVHDLNKAPGEPLRQDAFRVRRQDGAGVPTIHSPAEVVGLNHYGARTRAALDGLVTGGLLGEDVAAAIDRVILHHGFGSSRFVRALVAGQLAWGKDDYLDEDGRARYAFPSQPPTTLASVLHDLADSAQQMQVGPAWIAKYPLGYWRKRPASWLEHLTGELEEHGIPFGLKAQMRAERATGQAILSHAVEARILSESTALKLDRGVEALIAAGRDWVDDREEVLHLPRGTTVYHQLGQSMGEPAPVIHERLSTLRPGDDPDLDARLERVAHTLDDARARQLHATILRPHNPRRRS